MDREKLGNIVVSTYNEKDLSPVSNAQVEIMDMEGNLVKTLKTNEYGNTEELVLPARSPYDTSGITGKYIIYVTHTNYQPVTLKGIQIFEGSKSLPTIKLSAVRNDSEYVRNKVLIMEDTRLPIEKEIQSSYNLSHFSLSPTSLLPSTSHHSYHSPGLSDSAAPIFSIGLIIPEFVRLQLFSSNGSARTVEVPFIDYIKGVAHIEIQGFTEDEAIKACVIAMVSFTLNRIYTEHYRRQNKDYDITNSTKDQDYVEHYTPQEPLIRNIEEVFSDYVEYPGGQSFPFLTQYCGNCGTPGLLNLTATRELAKKQQRYIDILKHYYGQNFNTLSATGIIIKNRFYSFIAPIKLGSSGQDVYLQQHYLEVIGKNYGIPTFTKAIDEKGEFGKKSEEAVKLFQRQAMRMSKEKANGIIDRKTWYTILNRYHSIVENTSSRNYHPISPPPKNIPLKKKKLKETVEFFPYLASWIYIWTKESNGKEGFWFWPAYIAIDHFQGYTWKNNDSDYIQIYDRDIYAVGYPPQNEYGRNLHHRSKFQDITGTMLITKKGIKRLNILPNTSLYICQTISNLRNHQQTFVVLYPKVDMWGNYTNGIAKITLEELLKS
ncbi:SpoIID/LytB domain-containing protein [Priestia sp. HNGD-A6]|uniref:SpoIID/LytB domain-containing protein n=1 Tax=Priestia sp. HNGD-A6 TaxID=3092666 RepID=UPI003892C6FC